MPVCREENKSTKYGVLMKMKKENSSKRQKAGYGTNHNSMISIVGGIGFEPVNYVLSIDNNYIQKSCSTKESKFESIF